MGSWLFFMSMMGGGTAAVAPSVTGYLRIRDDDGRILGISVL